MYSYSEPLSPPEDKAQLNIHSDLWVDPREQFTGSGTIAHLADNNGIIPLGSFHHCHLSWLWLMFPLVFFSFFSPFLSLKLRGRRNRSRRDSITKGKQRVIDWLVNKRAGQAAAEETVPGEPSLLILHMWQLHPSYLIITGVTGRDWRFKIRRRKKAHR